MRARAADASGAQEASARMHRLNNDLLMVYSFFTGAMGVRPENIILFGYSIGTGPTTHLAANKTVRARADVRG